MNEIFRKKLDRLPESFGVYQMINKDGKIIYVGKAKNLKKRVISYFRKNVDRKTIALVENIEDIKWFLTSSEKEALILEASLIKENSPKYNILLRDDKHFPYIKIDLNKDYPRIEVVRKKVKGGKKVFFGPYTSSKGMNEMISLLNASFSLRTCSDRELKRTERPCLNYQINKCSGPCCSLISKDEYRVKIDRVISILKGNGKSLIKDLRKNMFLESERFNYEEAGKIRDQIFGIEHVTSKQNIDNSDLLAIDVIGTYIGEGLISVNLVKIREGVIIGNENYFLDFKLEASREEVVESFLIQYYLDKVKPREIYLEEGNYEIEALKDFLSDEKIGVKIHIPIRGSKKNLVELATINAKESYHLKVLTIEKKVTALREALSELKLKLGLNNFPNRIECYDISNIQGTNTVASMVVFKDGEPDKKQYRRFKIKTVEGPNDFASMEEVIARRFQNLVNGEDKFSIKPDLIIIDGGKGQLSSTLKILDALGIEDIDVFGLAKREEELFRRSEKEPIVLSKNSPGLHIIQQIRDEAHRFAITFHREIRGKGMVKSVLDSIDGIGPRRKKLLLDRFKSVGGIRRANILEINEVLKNRELSTRVKEEVGDE